MPFAISEWANWKNCLDLSLFIRGTKSGFTWDCHRAELLRAASASERGCCDPRAEASGGMTNPPPFRSGLVTWEPHPSGRCVVAPLRSANHGTRQTTAPGTGGKPQVQVSSPVGAIGSSPGRSRVVCGKPGVGGSPKNLGLAPRFDHGGTNSSLSLSGGLNGSSRPAM